MSMRESLATVVVLTLGLCGVVRAQGEIRGTEVGAGAGEETVGESRVARIHAVERGLWFSVDYGPYYQIPINIPQETCLTCVGSQVGLRLGYDIFNNLEANAFVRGSFANFKTEYKRLYSGDVASYYAGAGARFSYITIPPPLNRFHATARIGGGLSLLMPPESAGNNLVAPTVDVALGFEYFTRLRHFSIGAEASSVVYLWPFSAGFSVLPTFKYTF